MKVRIFDKFDPNETIVIWEDVSYIDGIDIGFEDGEIFYNVISQNEDYEILED